MGRIGSVAAVLVLAMLAAAPGQAAPRQITYVAGTTGVYFTGFTRADEALGGDTATGGYFTIKPAGSTLRLTIDDHGALDGTNVRVRIWNGSRPLFDGCFPVRERTAIRGVKTARPLYISIGDFPYGRLCSGLATAGVATIQF